MRLAAIGAATLALTGCMDDRPGGPVPPRACVAEAGQAFVGQPYRPRIDDRIRRRTHSRTIRVVRPGEMVTMDFRPDRVTVSIDEAGRIGRVSCG